MMQKKIILFSFIVMLLLSGCLQNVTGPKKYYLDEASKIRKFAIYDEEKIEECKLGECICLACENRTSWFGFMKSFSGGHCNWVRNCTSTRFAQLVNGTLPNYEEEVPWQFMIGQGYSFSDFSDANGWCGNRLDMAVQWLVGDNDTEYSMPDPDRSVCMLDKEIIPVYVLYSHGENIDPQTTYKIAEALGNEGPSPTGVPGGKGPVGPVIITTEIDFNGSDANVIRNITEQIKEINRGCRNERYPNNPEKEKIYCFVALAPKMGDYKSVNTILAQSDIASQVDLIAFGINSHTVNLSENKAELCNPGFVYQQALTFARFSMYNHSKPTVIPYMLFDSAGQPGEGDCIWTEKAMIDAYADFFKRRLITFQKSGVVGVAPYDFNSSQFSITNPLGCIDCNLGKNEERMASWFGLCRSYKILAGKYRAGDNMIRFANESGGYCESGTQATGILQLAYGNSMDAITPDLKPANETFLRCDSCVSNNFSIPFDIPSFPVINAQNNESYCLNNSIIEFYSGKRNLDPMLVRALIQKESDFNRCAAAPVSKDKGIDYGCYPKAYDYVKDPDVGGACDANEYPRGADGLPTYRYCALGIMQTLIPPWTFWPAHLNPEQKDGDSYWPNDQDWLYHFANEVEGRSGESQIPDLVTECSPKFNPFNATHSICWGTYHLKRNLDTVKESVVQKNLQVLAPKDDNARRVLEYYIALHYYRGYGNYVSGWISVFGRQKRYIEDPNHPQFDQAIYNEFSGEVSACKGQQDFIKYVRECQFCVKDNPKVYGEGNKKGDSKFCGDYGSAVLARYIDFRDKCPNAGCPSCKRFTLACKNPPTSCPPPADWKCELKVTIKAAPLPAPASPPTALPTGTTPTGGTP